MNAPLNLFLFLIFICFLIPLLFFFFKLRKKDYRLTIQETKLDQINQEVSKIQHENDLIRRKLEEQKIKLEQEESRIKTEREKLANKSQKISEEEIFHEQEKNKLQARIQNVKEKFQDIINKVDRKNVEVEKKINEIEGNRKNIEIDRAKLEAAKKEINNASKEIHNEWQKIRLEKERLEKQKTELNEKDNEIQEKEQQYLEERKFIDNEKERIKGEWQQIEVKKEETEKQASILDERDKEFNEKRRQFEIGIKLLESEKLEIENERQQIQNKREELEKQNNALKDQVNGLKEKEKYLEDKERQQDTRTQKLDEKEKELTREREETETTKPTPPIKPIEPEPMPIPGLHPKPDGPKLIARIIPELICWKKAGCWQVAIKISGRLPDCSNLKIIQDGVNLVKDEGNEEFWPLISLSSVLIEWNDGDKLKKKKFQMHENGGFKPLLFKLSSQNDNFGKFVNSPSSGNYFVVVPEDWRRDENLSGTAPSEPEPISIRGFKGHFFILKKAFNAIIAFKNSAGELVTLEPKGSRFDLKGNQITDANEEVVPLFGGEFPIIIDSIRSWNDIEVLVIEDEGDEKSEHRWIFTPDINSSEIDLNQVEPQGNTPLSQSTSSSFLISLYDKEYHLIDNLYFRYIRGMKKIDISCHSCIPDPDGHEPVEIKFHHEDVYSVKLMASETEKIIIDRNDVGTVATIYNDPTCDLTIWKIKDNSGREVELAIDVERVWWCLANESDHPDKKVGTDKPVELSIDQFKAFSNLGIYIWLPKTNSRKTIFVGFEMNKIKPFLRKIDLPYVFIPLRELGDYEPIQNFYEEQYLKLWLDERGDENTVIGTVRLPMLYCQISGCNFKTQVKKNMTNHIRDCHFNNFVKKLSYEEIRLKYNLDWPKEIYKCGYCDYHIPADNKAVNPTQAIIDHIEKECSKKRVEDGRAKITFSQIKDIDEIRAYVIPDLPEVHQCTICREYLKNQNNNSIINHLVVDHEEALFKNEPNEKGAINESNIFNH